MLVICLSYVSDGGMYSVSPAICINSFGMKNAEGNFQNCKDISQNKLSFKRTIFLIELFIFFVFAMIFIFLFNYDIILLKKN